MPSPVLGAADGTRTRTVSLPGDFKSPVSTDSTTAAATRYNNIFLDYRQGRFGEPEGRIIERKWENLLQIVLFRGQITDAVL